MFSPFTPRVDRAPLATSDTARTKWHPASVCQKLFKYSWSRFINVWESIWFVHLEDSVFWFIQMQNQISLVGIIKTVSKNVYFTVRP